LVNLRGFDHRKVTDLSGGNSSVWRWRVRWRLAAPADVR